MATIIFRQPNGRLCRFSTIVDCITHYNMTDMDYIQFRIENAIGEAIRDAQMVLNNRVHDYSELDEYFRDYNMTKEEFEEIKKKMEEKTSEFTEMEKT